MAGASDQTIFDMIRKSNAYKAIDYRDKAKVELALNNKPSNRPSSWIGQAAWELAKRNTVGPPPVTPDPPPVTYKKVAPRTYNYAPSNNSDPRFCVHGQPGVTQRPDGLWTDESGAVYDDEGRDTAGVRSRLTQVAGLRQADNSDGMPECQLYDGLTAWPGDPKANTGSWAI